MGVSTSMVINAALHALCSARADAVKIRRKLVLIRRAGCPEKLLWIFGLA
jgi:hypothetical protein